MFNSLAMGLNSMKCDDVLQVNSSFCKIILTTQKFQASLQQYTTQNLLQLCANSRPCDVYMKPYLYLILRKKEYISITKQTVCTILPNKTKIVYK